MMDEEFNLAFSFKILALKSYSLFDKKCAYSKCLELNVGFSPGRKNVLLTCIEGGTPSFLLRKEKEKICTKKCGDFKIL